MLSWIDLAFTGVAIGIAWWMLRAAATTHKEAAGPLPVASPKESQPVFFGGALRRPPRPNVLFLDFDGVLHPGTSETLIRADMLAAMLKGFPEVDVVLTTTWRLSMTLEAIVGLLPAALGDRVVGATRELPGPFQRQREIMDFVCQHRLAHWVALDDTSQLFEPYCSFLILTNPGTGLDEPTLKTVASRLAAWRTV